MKTISEFADTMLEKDAAQIGLEALPALLGIPAVAGGVAGKIYSDVTAPATRKHETFQTDLLKSKLTNILQQRRRDKKINKLREVLSGSQRSIRL